MTDCNEINRVWLKRIDKRFFIFIEKAARARQSEIAKKMKTAKGFYTLEMAPPNYNEMAVCILLQPATSILNIHQYKNCGNFYQ